MHTNNSDGFLEPSKLCSHMSLQGVTVIAITDHDVVTTLDGDTLDKHSNMQVIIGSEITTQWQDNSIHVLGLNLSSDRGKLEQLLLENRNIRKQRSHKIAEHLDNMGFKGSLDYIQDKYKPVSIGRLHFARFLLDSGYVNNIGKAFSGVLSKVELSDFAWPSLQQVIEAIHSANGSAVLAHPLKYKFSSKQVKSLIKDFAYFNGDAVEYISGNITHKEMMSIHDIIGDSGLKASIGSDFHAPMSHNNFTYAKYCTWLESFQVVWSDWE